MKLILIIILLLALLYYSFCLGFVFYGIKFDKDMQKIWFTKLLKIELFIVSPYLVYKVFAPGNKEGL